MIGCIDDDTGLVGGVLPADGRAKRPIELSITLVSRGVSSDGLATTGFGSAQSAADSDSAECRASRFDSIAGAIVAALVVGATEKPGEAYVGSVIGAGLENCGGSLFSARRPSSHSWPC